MIDICFTVLHYGKEDITIKCINSLIRISKNYNYKIIVLDNGSNNNSFEKIKIKYSCFDSIIIIRSDENLGFSRGNNLLYQKAKQFNPMFIAVLNNDIEIIQNDFIKILFKISNEFDAYVIGPDVYCPNIKMHQAPLFKSIPEIRHLERKMEINYQIINHPENKLTIPKPERYKGLFLLLPQFVVDFLRYIKHLIKGSELNDNKHKFEVINPVLQGSCIILTNRFIEKEVIVFEPDTTFYFEELLLAQKCRFKNYKTVYSPKLKVIHHHSYASRNSSKNYEEYIKKQAQRMVSAFEIYKKNVKETIK